MEDLGRKHFVNYFFCYVDESIAKARQYWGDNPNLPGFVLCLLLA